MIKNLPENMAGTVYIFISALMYATLPIMAKVVYSTGIEPLYLFWLRYLFAFIMIAGYFLLTKQGPVISVSRMVIFQGLLVVLSGVFYFISLKYLAAGMCSIIFFTHPVIVSVLALVIFREKVVPRLLLGLLLAVTGIFMISGTLGNSIINLPAKGLIYCILSCLTYAGYLLAGQKNLASSSPLSMASTFAFLGIVLVPLFFGRSAGFFTSVSMLQLLLILAMALINTILPMFFLLSGVKKIGASRGSLISSVEPVLTIIIAYLALGEVLAPIQLAGSALVFVSIILALPSEPKI